MKRYLAVHEVPQDLDSEAFRASLGRIADVSTRLGVRPIETIYSLDARRAFTLFSADSEADVREAYERAEFSATEVMPVDRVFTELLHVPQRERWS